MPSITISLYLGTVQSIPGSSYSVLLIKTGKCIYTTKINTPCSMSDIIIRCCEKLVSNEPKVFGRAQEAIENIVTRYLPEHYRIEDGVLMKYVSLYTRKKYIDKTPFL